MEIRPILSTLLRHKTAAALIVLEIAFSCAIVCNALFLITERIENVSRPSGIAEQQLLQVRLSGIGPADNADARTREDLAALRAVPGVAGVTLVNQLPFYNNSSNSGLTLTPDQERATLNAAQYMAYDGMLDTLGIRLSAGRDFLPGEYVDGSVMEQATDYSALSSPAIISAAVAEKMFPGGDAVGRTVYLGPIPLTVVGVAETLTRPNGVNGGNMSYSFVLPIRPNYNNGGFYMLRVDDPARRAEVLKAAVAALEQVDPNRLVLDQRSYSEIRERFFRSDREMIGLLLVVCVALLVVTALGIVGLASFWVQQRSKQIGIRRALGATRSQILRYFQTENFLLATIGIVLGMVLAYAINLALMERYELARLPMLYLPAGAVALWLLGQLAVLGPARRAAAVPPAVATRSA
ncbi:ABC transporter permease [Lysobacter sp. GX 14042]|uniref:ABC transporter permease n=1 Tax=Lysobacter sp. GX 14042 TaxID=2907155 RepID=UPI001F3A7FAE|nr:FtsX-like permease family protein [Lysobacter sp. GX 14042]MCE7033077.1 ABC transporter permease [Lysobacter sp. GX 14042]